MAKARGKDIEILFFGNKGKIIPLMWTGYYGLESVFLDQERSIAGMRAGDICRYRLGKAIIVGFSDDDNSNNPNSLLTRAWIIPKERTQTSCGLRFRLIHYPGDYFDIINIEIIRRTKSPLKAKTTKRRILNFLNS